MFGPHTTPPAEHCAIERTSKAMHLHPVGEVDLGTVPILWSNLKAMLEDNLNVIVDLKGIQDIDSTGIRALLDAHSAFHSAWTAVRGL
jgi:anti-anti-sigma factor